MWPLDTIRARRHQRRYECAIALFAADFTLAQLEKPERSRVEAKLTQLLLRAGVTPAEHKRWDAWEIKMGFVAEAMFHLGIQPVTAGLHWPRFVGAGHGLHTASWALHYRAIDEATRAAAKFMKERGTYVERNPLDQPYIEPDQVPRPTITVREWYLRKARELPPNKSLERTREG